MEIKITESAKKDLKNLDPVTRNRVKEKLTKFGKGLVNIEKLSARDNKWKIRVGNYRIIVEKIKDTLYVSGIEHRREVYRKL